MHHPSLSILLLEDNLTDALLLKRVLLREANDWTIHHCQRFSEVLLALETSTFDIALLDLSVPDSHGLETVTRFQAVTTALPIVVLTGRDDREAALQALAVGAQDYLVKNQLSAELLVRTLRYAVERGRILRSLQESEYRFRGAFNQTFQAMSLLTPAGIVKESNQTLADLESGHSQLVPGLPLWETALWRHDPAAQERLRAAVAQAACGDLVRFESQVRRADGELGWVDISLKPLRDSQDEVWLLIFEARDISDRKRAEIQIQQALEKERELNQMKSSFISMVSHEFRTPMAIIRTASELLKLPHFAPEKQEKYFKKIDDSIDTMLRLLDEVLLLGRTESGKFQYHPEPVNLEELCLEVVEAMQAISSPNHSLQLTYSGPLENVQADRSLLHHILLNLLSNAVKYSPQGGVIEFQAMAHENTLIFRIQDPGMGIPQADQGQLFETFHRGQNARHIPGTGLGLAIVKNCVDLHGGHITYESEEDVGTTFTVTLPLVTAGQPASRREAAG